MEKTSLIRKLIREAINSLDKFHISTEEVRAILIGYLAAALWTEEENLNQSYKENNSREDKYDDEDDYEDDIERAIKSKTSKKEFTGFGTNNIAPDSKIQAYVDIKKFILNAGVSAVSEALDDNGSSRFGMDIWLTRNGHGSGFFDHGYEFEQDLNNAAKSIGEVYLYLGDDGHLHFSNEG